MNREIKFRVFDKKTGKTFKAHDLRFTAEEAIYEVCHDTIREDGGKHWEFTDFKEVVLMQYTGFKDFDGKEIYEGDIIQFTATRDGTQHKKRLIYFDEDCGAWYCKNGEQLCNILFEQNNDDWKRSENWSINEKQYIRIIGNIFENPNLLT